MPAGPEVTPPAEPSSEAIFASDEEALAAATDAYEAYQTVLNEISHEGGANPERISTVVTSERLVKELEGLSSLAKSGRRLVGDLVVRETTLQQFYLGASGVAVVAIYACIDPIGVQVIDANGVDVTPDELRRPWPREAVFETADSESSDLLLSSEESWTGGDLC